MTVNDLNLPLAKTDHMVNHVSERTAIEVNNEELVKGCRAGDRNNQRLLFQKYRETVYCIISHNLGPQYDKDDVLQQIFINIYRSLNSFKGLSSLDTWVYRIAVKVCMDQLRKKYRKRQIVVINNPDILEHNSESKQATPAKDTEEKELSEQIFHALNKLSPEKRIVVTMFEMEGFSLEDIAHIIKKPLGTVKSRLFHGRKELASHLQTYMDT